MPRFGAHMTPLTHNGLSVPRAYKGAWNPVTGSHSAARSKDLRQATDWALDNYPPGRVRRATTSGGNPSRSKIEILRDGGDPNKNSDWIEQTWHHHENGRDIIPVPTEIHNSVSHAGGFAAKHGPDGSTITPDTDITEIFNYDPLTN